MTMRPLVLASTLGLALLPRLAPAAPCDVAGKVVDAEGKPLVGLDVRLDEKPTPRHTTTDDEGRFRFTAVAEATMVVATLRDGGKPPRFTILSADEPVELRAPVDPATTCEPTLDPADGPPTAAELMEIYQGVRRGFALIDRLGIRGTASLSIETDDGIASPRATYWTGPPSYNPEDPQPPRIVMGTEATRSTDGGHPDNREYHELGHHALALAFGALPRSPDNLDGGGYHRNPSSAAAWTEGFATFFAAMVAREIEQRPHAERHRIAGAWLDLELDYRPWDLRGLESVAVASLLWDMVDGAREGKTAPLTVEEPTVLTDAGVPHLLVARVINGSTEPVSGARVRVSTDSWLGTAPVAPALLPPGGEGWLALPLPAEIATLDDPIAALTLRAITSPSAPDDDPVQVELAALWTAIAELRSDRSASNGRLFDVADLYLALRGRFGGKDADGDGYDDVDQLFAAHGLFADLDGDRQRSPAEALGPTSHPGRTLEIDGHTETWPELVPRNRITLPPALTMKVQTEPADAAIAVVIPGSAWGGYLAQPDDEGLITLVPPPAVEGGSISVIALAPGRRPTVLLHREALPMLAELEQHEAPYLTGGAKLPAFEGAPSSAAGSPQWPRVAFVGGVLAALLGLVLMAIGWPRLR
ncbi:MAG: carboxypeptidase regulatory-like domain-containing protein [Myxococcales bacterium]|nr:carboxypeptidase regulatory-like domain-containing protein [Myxococcales bacterium]